MIGMRSHLTSYVSTLSSRRSLFYFISIILKFLIYIIYLPPFTVYYNLQYLCFDVRQDTVPNILLHCIVYFLLL